MEAADKELLYDPFPPLRAWLASPTSTESWNHYARRLAEDRERATEEDFAAARQVALRAAAVDTGAIEDLYEVDRGFTMTVAYQAAAWQHEIDRKGGEVRDLFAAQLEGYRLVLDAATRRTPISEAFVRQLHATLTRPQETYRVWTEQGWQSQELPRGEYKAHPNNPFSSDQRQLHAYAPPLEVAPEMHRLTSELECEEFLRAEAVEQAAYAHYALVRIHPFADGNGRVARALASLFLLRATSTPLVVFADQRGRYLEALRAADAGRYHAFSFFVAERSIETMLLVGETLKGFGTPHAPADADFFREVAAQHGLTPSEIDQLADRLAQVLEESLQAARDRLGFPSHLELAFGRQDDHREAPAGHRVVSRQGGQIIVTLRNHGPGGQEVTALVRVLPVTSSKSPHLLLVEIRFGDHSERFEVRRSEVSPSVSEGFQMRLDAFARRLLHSMIGRLREHTEKSLRERGWSPRA